MGEYFDFIIECSVNTTFFSAAKSTAGIPDVDPFKPSVQMPGC
jgi:hypothetical protein